MNRNLKIGIGITSLLIIAGTLIYIRSRKRRSFSKSEIDLKVNDRLNNRNVNVESFEKEPVVRNIKDQLKSAYYPLEILENRNGQVFSKTSGKKVDDGLAKSVWIQVMRRKKELQRQIQNFNVTDSVRLYATTLVDNFEKYINSIFDPKKYNTNTLWYREYINKGGTPI